MFFWNFTLYFVHYNYAFFFLFFFLLPTITGFLAPIFSLPLSLPLFSSFFSSWFIVLFCNLNLYFSLNLAKNFILLDFDFIIMSCCCKCVPICMSQMNQWLIKNKTKQNWFWCRWSHWQSVYRKAQIIWKFFPASFPYRYTAKSLLAFNGQN